LALKLGVTEWYQSHIVHRNGSLDRRVIFKGYFTTKTIFTLSILETSIFFTHLQLLSCFPYPLCYGKEFIDFFQTLSKFCISPAVTSFSIMNSGDLSSSKSLCVFLLDIRSRKKRTPNDQMSASYCVFKLYTVWHIHVYIFNLKHLKEV
jgi:hypothetical protein